MTFLFDSHGGDSQLNARTGQTVEILRALTEQEADLDDVGPMFRIRFEDGYETDAFADELTPAAMDGPQWFAITRWCAEDIVAVAEECGVALTEEQAVAWWKRNERRFQNLLVEAGNEIMSNMDFKEVS